MEFIKEVYESFICYDGNLTTMCFVITWGSKNLKGNKDILLHAPKYDKDFLALVKIKTFATN